MFPHDGPPKAAQCILPLMLPDGVSRGGVGDCAVGYVHGLRIPICVPPFGKTSEIVASYHNNLFGRNKKLIGFGLGAPPRAQIRGLFVSTKGVSEIISILVEIARR